MQNTLHHKYVIDTLYKVAKAKVADDVKRSGLFKVLMDGTTEKQGHELVGIVARYVDSDTYEIAEHVIDIKDATDDKSAEDLLDVL